MVWCHWDNQPRNIFWCEARQQIYLLDFEDCRLAYPEADLAHLFLFWAEQMPHTVFTSCIYCFLQTYTASFPLASHRWQTEVRKARRRFLARRRKYNKKEPLSNPDRSANLQYLLRLDL